MPQLAFPRRSLGDVQHGQAVRICEGRPAKHGGIHEAEDRRGAPNAKREGKERGRGKHRRAPESPHGVSQVVEYHCANLEAGGSQSVASVCRAL